MSTCRHFLKNYEATTESRPYKSGKWELLGGERSTEALNLKMPEMPQKKPGLSRVGKVSGGYAGTKRVGEHLRVFRGIHYVSVMHSVFCRVPSLSGKLQADNLVD